MTLEERIASKTIDELRLAYRNELMDWAATDTYVKIAASKVLPKEAIEDEYSFVGVEDIVDMLVDKILALREIEALDS